MSSEPSSVKSLSSHTIQCSTPTATDKLERPFRLGPLDRVHPFIPIAVVYVFLSPGTPQDDFIPVSKLSEAMSRVLDYYPQLTGRLRIGSNGRRVIESLGTGAELNEATCDLDLKSKSGGGVTMYDLPGQGGGLLGPWNYAMDGFTGNPLLQIQHTRFACGSVTLGIRQFHTVCDGSGFFQLVTDLADIYRQLGSDHAPSLSHPPEIHSLMFESNTQEEREAALAYRPEFMYTDAQEEEDVDAGRKAVAKAPPPAYPTPTSAVVGRFMRFSSQELETIKAAATPKDGSAWISTFDAICAHIHHRLYLARKTVFQADELSTPDFLSPVNLRFRQAGIPDRYYPNALVVTTSAFEPTLVAEGPLSAIAQQIHQMTRTPGTTVKEEIRKIHAWIDAQTNYADIKIPFRLCKGSTMISQWNKEDLYTNARLDSIPDLVSPPFTPISSMDGLGYLLPTSDRQGDPGAIDVCLALSAPVWDVLDKDPEFGGKRLGTDN